MLADVQKRKVRRLHETHDSLAVSPTLVQYFTPDARGRESVKFEFLIRNWLTPKLAFPD